MANKIIEKILFIINNYWKKFIMILGSFCLIIVVFDYLMGNTIVVVKSSMYFSLIYIFGLTAITMLLKKKYGIFFYTIIYWIFSLISIAQVIHYRVLNSFFGITDLTNLGEGLSFISFINKSIDVKIVIAILLFVLTYILTLLAINKHKQLENTKKMIRIKIISVILTMFLVIFGHFGVVNFLGEKVEEEINFFDSVNQRNLYDSFTNRNTCMQITQIYEYTIRDIYMYLKKNYSSDEEAIRKEIDEYFDSNLRSNNKNEYTGIFENENLIFILMESIDTWLINKKTMPNLYKLQQEGINFTNHYASNFGGGRTFNSEFAANTGLYIPNNGYNIYNSVNNDFSPSLANLFKNKGYTVNSVHANAGNFYNRNRMHKSFGYENSYFLFEMPFKENVFIDTNLVSNDKIYEYIVPSDKFMTFIITYSGHGKYVDNSYCDEKKLSTEIKCIKYLYGITDDFLGKLIKRLEEDEILDNTTLVLFTDHYAYGYDDIEYLKEKKKVREEKDIEKVPFIIWNNRIENKVIDYFTDTADILPTIANMFNLDADMNNYLGTDIFSENHENYVYFGDYSYVNKDNENLNKKVAKKIDINDKILISDYFRYKNN